MFKLFFEKNLNKGMTFIELIVVMGIFTAISATVLFNYRDFSDGVELQNLGQEIALQGKRAQTLASQGRSPLTLFSNVQRINIEDNPGFLPFDFVSSYGIAFNTEDLPQAFIFYFNSFDPDEENLENRLLYFHDFVDSNYTVGDCEIIADSECLEEIRITNGSYIELICLGGDPQTDPNCLVNGSPSDKLHISYTRPFLESYILGQDISIPVSNAFVKISSRDGDQKRYINFWSTGQISVY